MVKTSAKKQEKKGKESKIGSLINIPGYLKGISSAKTGGERIMNMVGLWNSFSGGGGGDK